jgi:hypothetical protein
VTSDRFATVAWVYDQGELALLLSLFDRADIWVVPITRGHVSVQWWLTVALGGMRLRVHEEDAEAALALLAGLERMPQTSVRILFRDKLADVLLILLFFLLFVLAPPARIQAEFAMARREHST